VTGSVERGVRPIMRWWVAVVWLVFVTPCGTFAQTLAEILAHHVQARGGLERLQALETLRMSGTVSLGPENRARVRREIARPGRIRTEFEYQGVTAVYACDGSSCWSVEPLSGSFDPQPMSQERSVRALAQAQPEGPLVDWQAKGYQAELVGKTERYGREVFEIVLTGPSGLVQHEFIDSHTWLVLASESSRGMGSEVRDTVVEMDDYRQVDGLLFPHSFKVVAPGNGKVLEIVVEEVELNPDLEDSLFAMPEPPRDPDS
jgi:outer membrane lipoprotein-sorting protein